MSLAKETELLRNIPLFADIEPSKLKLLAFTSERLTYAPGEALFQQGDAGDAAYIIVSGSADVLVATPQGPLVVATLRENEIVGEIAILCGVPRTATVRAREQLTALRISKELFFGLLAEFPQIALGMLRELARRLDATTTRLREAVSQSPGRGEK